MRRIFLSYFLISDRCFMMKFPLIEAIHAEICVLCKFHCEKLLNILIKIYYFVLHNTKINLYLCIVRLEVEERPLAKE